MKKHRREPFLLSKEQRRRIRNTSEQFAAKQSAKEHLRNNPFLALNGRNRCRMAKFLGGMYREARSQTELSDADPSMWPETAEVRYSRSLVQFIDQGVQACTREHGAIIRRVFLEGDESQWYLEFYSSTQYMRVLKQALEEFYSFLGKPASFYDNIHP